MRKRIAGLTREQLHRFLILVRDARGQCQWCGVYSWNRLEGGGVTFRARVPGILGARHIELFDDEGQLVASQPLNGWSRRSDGECSVEVTLWP